MKKLPFIFFFVSCLVFLLSRLVLVPFAAWSFWRLALRTWPGPSAALSRGSFGEKQREEKTPRQKQRLRGGKTQEIEKGGVRKRKGG